MKHKGIDYKTSLNMFMEQIKKQNIQENYQYENIN